MKIDLSTILSVFVQALSGVPLTLEMTIVPFAIACALGFPMAIVNAKRVPVASHLFKVFISFMRGTPIIVQIFLIYNSMPALINGFCTAAGIDINVFAINPVIYAIAAFSLSETAILAEAFRAALNTVDKGQIEAAECVGLTGLRAYTRIVIPQALGSSIPVLGNAVCDLIKTTSLAFSMAILDVTGIAKVQGAASLDYIDAYIAVFLVYLILVLLFENLFALADKRLNAGRRPLQVTR
jgi:L-cystine transport system permease protein